MNVKSIALAKTQTKYLSLIIVAALCSVLLLGQQVFAARTSWLHNQSGGSIALRHWPTAQQNNPKAWVKSGTKFWMSCYTDHHWFNGNYNSNRWFYGQTDRNGWGYIHSSYVYYQEPNVPRC